MDTKIEGNANISGNGNKLSHYEIHNTIYLDQKSNRLSQLRHELVKLIPSVKNIIYRKGGHGDEVNATSFRLDDGNLFFFSENEQLIALYAANTWTHFVSGDIIVHSQSNFDKQNDSFGQLK